MIAGKEHCNRVLSGDKIKFLSKQFIPRWCSSLQGKYEMSLNMTIISNDKNKREKLYLSEYSFVVLMRDTKRHAAM